MTEQEMKRLELGDRVVIFPDTDYACGGAVAALRPGDVGFVWDDAATSGLRIAWVNAHDGENIVKARVK